MRSTALNLVEVRHVILNVLKAVAAYEKNFLRNIVAVSCAILFM